MDPLALLCNLHGDGPRTLARLRRVGLDSLAALLEARTEDLTAELGWSEVFAERFLREAGALGERAEGWLADEPEASGGVAWDQHDDAVEDAEDDADEDDADDGAPAAMEEVLGTWRELDRVDPPREVEAVVVPRPPAVVVRGGYPLEQALLPGVRGELARRLRARGVESLEALTAAEPLELARGVGLPYTRVARLQFLARRALATARPVAVGPEPIPRERSGSSGPP